MTVRHLTLGLFSIMIGPLLYADPPKIPFQTLLETVRQLPESLSQSQYNWAIENITLEDYLAALPLVRASMTKPIALEALRKSLTYFLQKGYSLTEIFTASWDPSIIAPKIVAFRKAYAIRQSLIPYVPSAAETWEPIAHVLLSQFDHIVIYLPERCCCAITYLLFHPFLKYPKDYERELFAFLKKYRQPTPEDHLDQLLFYAPDLWPKDPVFAHHILRLMRTSAIGVRYRSVSDDTAKAWVDYLSYIIHIVPKIPSRILEEEILYHLAPLTYAYADPVYRERGYVLLRALQKYRAMIPGIEPTMIAILENEAAPENQHAALQLLKTQPRWSPKIWLAVLDMTYKIARPPPSDIQSRMLLEIHSTIANRKPPASALHYASQWSYFFAPNSRVLYLTLLHERPLHTANIIAWMVELKNTSWRWPKKEQELFARTWKKWETTSTVRLIWEKISSCFR